MRSVSKTALKSFPRRHNRLLTIVGALIIFVTFVVKDGLREHYKDLMNDVSNANNVFAIRRDNMATRSQLRHIQERLASGGRADRVSSIVQLLGAEMIEMNWALDAISNLTYRSQDEEDAQHVMEHVQEISKIQVASLDLQSSLDELEKLEMRAMQMQLRLSIFQDKVMRNAQVIEERAKKCYDFFTRLSYVLFAIGWLLAILGANFGVGRLDAV